MDIDLVAENLVHAVEEAAHAQAVRGKFAVARDHEHLRIRDVGREQPRRDPAGLDHVLPDVRCV